VKWLCQIPEVSRSGFYRWRASAPARVERARADQELAEQIRVIHADSDDTYGSPRVTAELREAGLEVNHKRVERVMREHGIVGVHLRKPVRTTVPDPDAAAVPDLIQRDFTASTPNTRDVGDITLRVDTPCTYASITTAYRALSMRRRRTQQGGEERSGP
jgi:transposase InsO family protein